jgi:hypothetical protein
MIGAARIMDATCKNIIHVVILDLGSEIDVDLDFIHGILLLDGVQKGMEPLSCAKVTNYPSKVDLGVYQIR